jgi:hypothetical protein
MAAPIETTNDDSQQQIDSLEDLLRNNLSDTTLEQVNRIIYGKTARFVMFHRMKCYEN